jgi:LPS export ABC transporter permease LptG
MGLLGVGLLVRLERPGDFELAGLVQGWVADAWRRLRRLWPKRPGEMMAARRFSLLPLVIDGYVLSSFLFYLALLLASFILLTDIFTFFELLSDIVRNKIPLPRVGAYLFFLTPKLIYDLLPVSVLVATLVTFGVMAKNNEVIAMRACGVSLHRLAFPVMLCSLVLSGSLFAFDYYFIPDANRKQDAIRNEIKGRPPATYLNPNRKYVYGQGSRIYYYKYFDPAQAVMADVSVYEINPKLFRLDHVISAEKARWEPSLGTWVFQNGFRRSFEGVRVKKFDDFRGGASSYGHLNEPPSYFLKEVKLSSQMNFRELADYVRELQQSGFDTTPLQVQYHGKFAVPLFAFIMALIASPFAFSTGNRGAMAGAGVSLAIAITYLTVGKLFEAVGNLSQLPAPVAAWAPDSLFALAGAYLLLRLRT